MPERTSLTHPIRVDFIPNDVLGTRGRLGMTFAPGKKAHGIDGHWNRDLTADLARLRKEFATDVLVSLIEEHELGALHIERLPTAASEVGLTLDRFAIRDGGVPADAEQFARLVDRTTAHLRAGRNVVIHCRGGLGRTGVLAAVCLRALGVEPSRAIEIVRAAREGTIENFAQESFVRKVALSSGPLASRMVGCLLGGAVGDALGGAVEFMSTAAIREKFGPDGIREYASAYGRTGAITDDTQMTLFTAEGLLRAAVRMEDRGICAPLSVVHHAYLRWLATQGVKVTAPVAQGDWPDGWLVQQRELWSRRAPGNACLSALTDVDSLGSAVKNDSKGCGTVMRVAPVGALLRASAPDGKWPAFEFGVEVSRLTHGHPSGYYAGGFFAQLIAHLLDGLPLPDAVQAASVVERAEAPKSEEPGRPPGSSRAESSGCVRRHGLVSTGLVAS